MSLLRRPRAATGPIHDITPREAGWDHVGFALHRLMPGEVAEGATGDREAIVVIVEGRARIEGAGRDWGEMGGRLSVFDGGPPHALYLPPGVDWRAEGATLAEIAICTAPSPGGRPARRLGPEGIETVPRGTGTNLRHINNVAMEDRDVADSLLVTEVFTPAGHWSSYPPHRHDEDDFPRITLLEETYYHRLNPGSGYAHQRVFTEDGTLDETLSPRDRDVVLVPRGHHPCAAPHGIDLYYLNVMAGPRRNWRFALHPDWQWLADREG
ncbi:MAG: 5-deoxy-glucuronate isomerase [Hasllibacter sp.]